MRRKSPKGAGALLPQAPSGWVGLLGEVSAYRRANLTGHRGRADNRPATVPPGGEVAMKAPFTTTIPLKAQGSQNAREHWAARAKRVKRERDRVMLATVKLPSLIFPALLVTLTRVGPRELDFVNLCASLKAVQDGVASRLKVDDASRLVQWEFRQEIGDHAVRVDVTPYSGVRP